MSIGDLVKHVWRMASDGLVIGVIVGLDKDGDPIVFFNDREESKPYYKRDVEVISESR